MTTKPLAGLACLFFVSVATVLFGLSWVMGLQPVTPIQHQSARRTILSATDPHQRSNIGREGGGFLVPATPVPPELHPPLTPSEEKAISNLTRLLKESQSHSRPPSIDDVCKTQLGNESWAPYQDKIGVKRIVTDWSDGRIHVAPTLFSTGSPDAITEEKLLSLPRAYVFKRAHDTGGVIIVKEGVPTCLKRPCIRLPAGQKITVSKLAATLRTQ